MRKFIVGANELRDNKLKAKKLTEIVYRCLILIIAILAIIRWISAFNHDIVVINAEINSHISNFVLSLLFYLGIGYTCVLQKKTFKKIILLGLFIIVANVMCETIMGFMNTIDILDAIYGIAGTLIGFCYLLMVKKYGLEIIHDEN